MLTGVHPFQRESALERVHAIINSPASRLSETLDSDVAKKGDVPAAVEFGRVAAAPVNTLRQQPHRCQEISVCF